MSLVKNMPGKIKRQVSFHADQPRKAAKKQRDMLQETLNNNPSTTGAASQANKKAEKRVRINKSFFEILYCYFLLALM